MGSLPSPRGTILSLGALRVWPLTLGEVPGDGVRLSSTVRTMPGLEPPKVAELVAVDMALGVTGVCGPDPEEDRDPGAVWGEGRGGLSGRLGHRVGCR